MTKEDIQALMSEALEKYGTLALAIGNKEQLKKSIKTDSIKMAGISLLRLREVFMKLGDILEENETKETIVAVVPTGAMKATRAFTVAKLEKASVEIAVFFREGLVKQHGAEHVIENVKKELGL